MQENHCYYKIIPDGTVSDGALLEILQHIEGCHLVRCSYDVENKVLRSTPISNKTQHKEQDDLRGKRERSWERGL